MIDDESLRLTCFDEAKTALAIDRMRMIVVEGGYVPACIC